MSLEEVLSKLTEMQNQFKDLRKEVDDLKTAPEEDRSRSRSPRRLFTDDTDGRTPESSRTSTPWCDRDPAEKIDYSAHITFSDEEEGGGSEQLVEVSEQTEKLLKGSCTRSVPNESRRKIRSGFHLPKVPATRTPRLDQFLRTEIPQATRSLDKDLSKLQTFVLDALAPLTALLETDVDSLTHQHLNKATTAAVQLLGNANAHISRLRREKIVGALNKSLLPLVKEDTPYMEAAPDLFGSDFAKRSKEFLEQVKTIRSSLPAKPSGHHHPYDKRGSKPLFRRGQSSGRTGPYKRGGAFKYDRSRGDRQSHDNKN